MPALFVEARTGHPYELPSCLTCRDMPGTYAQLPVGHVPDYYADSEPAKA
jgi:hypothetical protein